MKTAFAPRQRGGYEIQCARQTNNGRKPQNNTPEARNRQQPHSKSKQYDQNKGCECTRRERDAILVAFAKHRKVLYGAAFDVVRVEGELDLADEEAVAAASTASPSARSTPPIAL